MTEQTQNVPLYTTDDYSIPYTKKSTRNIKNKSIKTDPYTKEDLDNAHDGYLQIRALFKEFGWEQHLVFTQSSEANRAMHITFTPFDEFTEHLATLIIEHGRADEQDPGKISWFGNLRNENRAIEAAQIRKSGTEFITYHLQQGIVASIPVKAVPVLSAALAAVTGVAKEYDTSKGRTTVPTLLSILRELHKGLAGELEKAGYEVNPHNTLALMLGHLANAKNLHRRKQQGDTSHPRTEYMEYITNGVSIPQALLFCSPLFASDKVPSVELAQTGASMPFTWFMKLSTGA